MSKPGGENVTEPGVEPTSSGCMTGVCTTRLKRSAVISGTGIHRLIYRDICVAATAHNGIYMELSAAGAARRICRLRSSQHRNLKQQGGGRGGRGVARHTESSRSWLQDTLKRKLVDFAWNRRFFYLPGACSPFFG